jgi:hypothetical protein
LKDIAARSDLCQLPAEENLARLGIHQGAVLSRNSGIVRMTSHVSRNAPSSGNHTSLALI